MIDMQNYGVFYSGLSWKHNLVPWYLSGHQENNHRHHHDQPSLSFLSSFFVLVQFTHINVKNIQKLACTFKQIKYVLT